MFNLITLNHFLLVAWLCLQYILLQFTVWPHYPYYILYPEQKTFTNYYALFPLQNRQFRPWGVCSLDDLWSFAASHSLMHFINRCTWKSSQYYIIISMMTSFMRMSQKLVFHQSKCICAIKHILSTAAMYVSSSSFNNNRSVYACFKSSTLRVGVKTLLNTIQIQYLNDQSQWKKLTFCYF